MELIPITEETLSPVSLKINGEWLETAIPRLFANEYSNKWCYFLTCGVVGRENDDVDVNATELPFDGSILHGKRRPSRTLNVSFYLESSSKDDVMTAYEFLGRYLNKLNSCKIIFGDDRNRYYEGTYAGMEFGGRGHNGSDVGLVGTISFFCKDRYKYSVSVKETTATYDSANNVLSMQIQNKGSIPVPIDYDVTFNQNSGYIGLVSAEGAMQFGDSEETATTGSRVLVSYTGEQLVNAINNTSDTTASDLSAYDDSTNDNFYFSEHFHTKDGKFAVDPTDNKYFAINKSTISKGVSSSPSFYGAGAIIKIKKTDVPVKNYKVEFQPWFETFKDASQKGLMQIFVVHKPSTGRATVISGIQLRKKDAANNTAHFYFKIGNGSEKGGKDWYTDTWTPNYESTYVENGPSVTFSKKGGKFSFEFGGKKKTYTESYFDTGGGGASLDATHLVIFIGNERNYTKWVGRYPISGDANSEVPRMRIGKIKMDQTDEITTTFVSDNTYKNGDRMVIDGSKATISVNGVNRVGDEKIGTEYFKAVPGTNEIQVMFSSFSTNNPPTVKARIREGWL